MKTYPIQVVRAIIENKNQEVLVLKRAEKSKYQRCWCLPGGKINFGDSAESSLKKNFEEIRLTPVDVHFLFYDDNLPEEGSSKHYLTLYFLCRVKGNILLNRESSEISWIEIF
jgi:mutator protein MutT